VTALALTALSDSIDRAGHLSVDPSSGLDLIATTAGPILRVQRRRSIWGKLTGPTSPYSFTQQFDDMSPTWANGPRTGTAYEVNGVAGLGSTVQRLYPDRNGNYRLQFVKGGLTPICGCTGIPPTLYLTIAAGYDHLVGTLSTYTDTLTYSATLGGWLGNCIGFTAGGQARRFFLGCASSGAHSFAIYEYAFGGPGGLTACASFTPTSAPLTASSPTAVASPCGATYYWTAVSTGFTTTGTWIVNS
jgi:hypothetical protein